MAQNPEQKLTMIRWIHFLSILGISLAMFIIYPVAAQDPTPAPVVEISDDQVNAIAKQMYCPVCENTPLDVCPTQACIEWRELIRDKLSEGWNEEQIKTYFVDRFGDRVLAAPPARGLNWFVYIVPPIVILLGLFLLYKAFRSFRQVSSSVSIQDSGSGAIHTAPSGSPSDEYINRLEEELRSQK